LIYGGFGIAKTVSVVLFNYLSAIINKFVYQSFLNDAQSERKLLMENNLITSVPKIFYLSVNVNDDYSALKSLIIAQATELPKN